MNEGVKENNSRKRGRDSGEWRDSMGCKGVVRLKGEHGNN